MSFVVIIVLIYFQEKLPLLNSLRAGALVEIQYLVSEVTLI